MSCQPSVALLSCFIFCFNRVGAGLVASAICKIIDFSHKGKDGVVQ